MGQGAAVRSLPLDPPKGHRILRLDPDSPFSWRCKFSLATHARQGKQNDVLEIDVVITNFVALGELISPSLRFLNCSKENTNAQDKVT